MSRPVVASKWASDSVVRNRRFVGFGFTLLELLLSLVVFAAIASIALPGASVLLADRRIVRGGDQLRTEMVRARVDAMRSGRVMMIEAAIDGSTFRVRPFFSATDAVESNDGAASTSALLTGAEQAATQAIVVDDSATRQFQIYETLKVTSVQVVSAARAMEISQSSSMFAQPTASQSSAASSASQQSDAAWSQPILFYPDGTTSTAAVTIADEPFGKVTVKLRGVNGDVSVTEVNP